MQMQYLQFFADKEELLEPFDDAERGRLFSAMLSYALHCEEIPLTGNERFVWPVFRQMIDQSRASLENKKKGGIARQQNGSSDQQPSADDSRPQQPSADIQQTAAQGHINKNQESRINNKNQETIINNEGNTRARAARFAPPDVSDVSSYAAEAGITLDAQQFCDYYASKGWRVGNSPMRDWRAAARNWARRDTVDSKPPTVKPPPGKQVGAQQYTQRTYTEDELANDITQELLAEAENEVKE